MGSPRRYDPDNLVPYCENDEIRSSLDFSNGLTPFFAIVPPSVQPLQAMIVGEYEGCIRKIKAPRLERGVALRFIPFEYHMGGIAV
jgi:hypothetical protein